MFVLAGCRSPICRGFDVQTAVSRFTPADLAELRDAVADALAAEEPLEDRSRRHKARSRPAASAAGHLDLSRLAGIRDYQPSELVLTAGAATPLEEIEEVLANSAADPCF